MQTIMINNLFRVLTEWSHGLAQHIIEVTYFSSGYTYMYTYDEVDLEVDEIGNDNYIKYIDEVKTKVLLFSQFNNRALREFVNKGEVYGY